MKKQGCENVASQIDQMTGWTYDKEADWLKRNGNYDQLKQQLAIEELEKLKQNVLKIDKIEIKVLKNGYSTLYCDRSEVIIIIDNQIKELKGEE